ncbi:MmgE/PrpD family protein [Aurantimonas sp. A3-2-R12]|uniref:MmgE/PrpD family protein n=1 Tax=Aurantimonas sp. A3-2-R12 TaxID=3114362 RepID=UPI002E19D8F7|nr:MmgE/PrpD family protein [Aurantimonas sp. A3-2-R12]
MSAGSNEISTVMRTVSAHVAATLQTEIPRDVAAKGKHHLLDTLAAMISGSRLRPGEMATAYAREQGGTPEACVIGSDIITSAVNAALANGMLAHADETDDSHEPSFSHPGCAVVPAALAMAERHGRSGADLLRAVVLGYDIGARFTLALDPRDFYARGFSSHAFAGLFGASAAAFALAGLDADAVRQGFSFTAQQASGLATWVRDEEHVEKAFDFAGMPARNAVASATMMTAGFTGVADVFSGDRNVFATFAPASDIAVMSRELGRNYEIMRANIKKWSVGSPIQAALDAIEHLMAQEDLTAGQVETILVRLPDSEAHIVDGRAMPDVNLQHLVAVLLVRGGLDFKSAHDYALMEDASVRAMRERIRLVADAELGAAVPRRQAVVEVATRDGRRLRRRTHAVRGTADNPMDTTEIEAKAFDLAKDVFDEQKAHAFVERIGEIETVADVRELRPLLQP